MLELRVMNIEDCQAEYDFFQEIDSENGFIKKYKNVEYNEFINKMIPDSINHSKGIDLPLNHVPGTYYFLWEDNQLIGLYNVRHCLNDSLRVGSGHIGYLIRKQYRKQGYGSKGLKLAINELCKKKEFIEENTGEIYLSC